MAEKIREENGLYYPPQDFVAQAYVDSREQYERMWKQSVEDPETFWGDVASELFWYKKWLKVNREDFSKGEVEWFIGGKTMIRMPIVIQTSVAVFIPDQNAVLPNQFR